MIGRPTLLLLAAGVFSGCAGHPPGNRGVQNGTLAPCPPSPNCVSSQGGRDHHAIAPLAFRGDPDAALARLRAVLEARADATVVSSAPDYLRVEFRTRLGFVDDGEFAVDRANRVVHVRSASRIGYSDLGKNRSRIEELRGALGDF